MTHYYRFPLIIGLALVFGSLTIAAVQLSTPQPPAPAKVILPPETPKPTATPVDIGEREYYRGVYDICVHYGLKSGKGNEFVRAACKEYVKQIIENGWYRQRSPGWEWPLPDGKDGA